MAEFNSLLHYVGRDLFWGVFLNGFCMHYVRLFIIVLLFGILFRNWGKSLGIPYLFLPSSSKRPLQYMFHRFAVGAGVGVVLFQCLLAGYLFEEFASNFTTDRPPFCEVTPQTESLWSYKDAVYNDTQYNTEPQYMVKTLRMPPASVVSFHRYSTVILCILMLAGGVVLLFEYLSKGFPPKRAIELRAVSFLGGVLGWCTFAAIMAFAMPNEYIKPEYQAPNALAKWVDQSGEKLADFAGWGHQALRHERLKQPKLHQQDVIEQEVAVAQIASRDTSAEQLRVIRERLRQYYPIYGLFCINLLAMIVWNLGLIVVVRNVSPAASILLLMHLVVGFQTVFDYFLGAPFFWLSLAGVILYATARRYKHRFWPLRKHYRHPVPLQQHYDTIQTADASTDRHWDALKSSEISGWSKENKKPLVVLCVSGGGSRAAAWTMKVLTELEARFAEKGIAFPYHIRLVSGASGGMVGAAYYTASLPEPDERFQLVRTGVFNARNKKLPYPSLQQLNDHIRQDFLTAVAGRLILPDLLLRPLMPLPSDWSRGGALEQTWSKSLQGWLDLTFHDMLPGEKAGWRPSLIFSPLIVEDGRQCIISNLSLRRTLINQAKAPAKDGGLQDWLLSREGLELFSLINDAQTTLPLCTAARMSASFPYLMPAVSLPTTPRRRLVDAGFYDNYGVDLAASWLFNHVGWIQDRVSQVHLIHIRDGLSHDERLMIRPTPSTDDKLNLLFEPLTIVLKGLNASRTAAGTLRNDNLVSLLDRFFGDHQVPFSNSIFEFAGGSSVSLSFCLTEEEQSILDGPEGIQHPRVQESLNNLLQRWSSSS